MAAIFTIKADGSKLSAVVNADGKQRTQTLQHLLKRVGTGVTADVTLAGSPCLAAELPTGTRTFSIRVKSGLAEPPTLKLADTETPVVFVTAPESGDITLGLSDPAEAAGPAGGAAPLATTDPRPPAAPPAHHAPDFIKVTVNEKKIAMVKCGPHHGDGFRLRLSEVIQAARGKTAVVSCPLGTTGCSLQAMPTEQFGTTFVISAVGETPLHLEDETVQAIRVTFIGDAGKIESIQPITAADFAAVSQPAAA